MDREEMKKKFLERLREKENQAENETEKNLWKRLIERVDKIVDFYMTHKRFMTLEEFEELIGDEKNGE
jgi:RNA binding exosome subunit